MAHDLWPWLIGVVVIVLGGAALSLALRRTGRQPAADLHERAIECWLAGDLGSDELKKLDLSVTPSKSGNLAVLVVLEGKMGGISKRFEEKRLLTVQPGRRERMLKSTRRTFDDEDW